MITALIDIDWSGLFGCLVPGGIGAVIAFFSKSGQDKAKAEAVKARAEAVKAEAEAAKVKLEARDKQVKLLEETLEHCLQREKKLHEDNSKLNETIDDKTVQMRKYVEETMECELTINKLYERNTELEREIGELKLELATKRCDKIHCPFRIPPTEYTLPHTGESEEQYHAQETSVMLLSKG